MPPPSPLVLMWPWSSASCAHIQSSVLGMGFTMGRAYMCRFGQCLSYPSHPAMIVAVVAQTGPTTHCHAGLRHLETAMATRTTTTIRVCTSGWPLARLQLLPWSGRPIMGGAGCRMPSSLHLRITPCSARQTTRSTRFTIAMPSQRPIRSSRPSRRARFRPKMLNSNFLKPLRV